MVDFDKLIFWVKLRTAMRWGLVPAAVIIVLAILATLSGGVLLAAKTSYLDSYPPEKVKELLGKETSSPAPN